jgi:hypothetical protein
VPAIFGRKTALHRRRLTGAIRLAFRVVSVPMPVTVATVHEQMHQRTGRQEQPRQERKDVSAVLGQQEENADDSEEAEYELGTRRPDIKVGFDRFGHNHCSITV